MVMNGKETDLIFFFNDTATTEIYTLSLHDALPICPFFGPWDRRNFAFDALRRSAEGLPAASRLGVVSPTYVPDIVQDRKSTRLNSSHANISYAVFCLKKKKHPRFTSVAPLLLLCYP